MSGFVFSATFRFCEGTRRAGALVSCHRWSNGLKQICCIPAYSYCSFRESLNLSSEAAGLWYLVKRQQKPSCTLPKSHAQLFSTSSSNSASRSPLHLSSKTHRNRASVVTTGTAGTKESPCMQTSPLRQRFIYLQTSVNRWEDVPGGIMFDTAYLDSAPGDNVNPAVPLVVSLHSTPGSFNDQLPVLEACAKAGCRVLAPAFPGHGLTEGINQAHSDVFTHSTSEKAEFVRDFLVQLGIERVDMLIGQGSGCYPALRLTGGKDTSSMFKSVAFLSPWPHRHFKGTRQKNLIPLVHDLWERPYYRPFARALSRFVPNTAGASSLERVTMVSTLSNLDFSEAGGLAVALDMEKVPRVMFFAEDDPFVDAALSHEMADLMGISSSNTVHFTGQFERGQMEQFPSCLVFDKGGQNLQHTHPGVVTAVLFNLLKSIRPGFMRF